MIIEICKACSQKGLVHLYTVCELCGARYCSRVWRRCPRLEWHPMHGKTVLEVGERYLKLEYAKREKELQQ